MSERRSKSNKKFMVLSALCIFMVVDHHTFTAFNLFGDFIPYNSFFMPLFVFISGYFNKVSADTKLLPYIVKKLKTLIAPYAGLSLLIFAVKLLMDWFKLGMAPEVPSWYFSYALERVFTIGSFEALATPMWFVLPLFLALTVYALLKKLLAKIWNSYVMLVIFCAMHLTVVYLAKTFNPEDLAVILIPLKALFFMPFLEMGIIYREHLESKHTGLPAGGKIALLAVLLGLNMIRTMYLPNAYDVAFDSLDDLSGFTSPFIVTPLVSSVIGMLFWLTMVDLMGKALYESRFVNYMSCNTFWIMGLHVTFFNIFNCILMAISEHIGYLPYFDCEYFRETEWYFWDCYPNFKMVYVVIGILGPLGLKWLWDKIAVRIADAHKSK